MPPAKAAAVSQDTKNKKTMKRLYTAIFLTIASTIASAQYTKLFDFNIGNGDNPTGDLISDGTFLYGMASQGGSN